MKKKGEKLKQLLIAFFFLFVLFLSMIYSIFIFTSSYTYFPLKIALILWLLFSFIAKLFTQFLVRKALLE